MPASAKVLKSKKKKKKKRVKKKKNMGAKYINIKYIYREREMGCTVLRIRLR